MNAERNKAHKDEVAAAWTEGYLFGVTQLAAVLILIALVIYFFQ